ATSACRTCCAVASASEYTATVAMPRRRQLRITRQAISPRLATRIRLNMRSLVQSLSRGLAIRRGSGAGDVADRFDVVAVGVQHEGAVVIGMIMGPQARCAVVAAARGKSFAMEGIDQCARGNRERDMRAAGPLAVADPEVRFAL